MLDGFVDLVVGEGLGDGMNAVMSREIEHFGDVGRATGRRASDRALGHHQGLHRERQRLRYGAEYVESTASPQCREEPIPVQRDVNCGGEKVERVSGAGDRFGITRVEDVVGAELERLFHLGFGRGERGDLASPCPCELDGEVSEAANADDTDSDCGGDAELSERSEDGDTPAHERSSDCRIDVLGSLNAAAESARTTSA